MYHLGVLTGVGVSISCLYLVLFLLAIIVVLYVCYPRRTLSDGDIKA
jgi:hypothetical protein